MKDVENIAKSACTGCAACQNICPRDAISMQKDDEGFLFPKVERTRCVSCGLCYQKCPAIFPHYSKEKEQMQCYAMQADDELRLKSSSGGAFTILAEKVLAEGGVVCGAAYGKDQMSVEHIFVSNKADLDKLRRSKYIQSDVGFCYREILRFLKQKMPVLFTGCPCQCAGLKAFLGRDYDELLIADVVCHGVPSSQVFETFVRSLPHTSNVVSVNFREKKEYGWTPTMDIFFEKDKEYYQPKWSCEYYDAFLKGIACRKSCGHCPFARLPRQGDITLGDFWGITKTGDKRFADGIGTSLVLLNTAKGRRLAKDFKERSKVFEEMDAEITRTYNANVFCSPVTAKSRERFFTLIKKYDFAETMRRVKSRHFEIGLSGWWYGKNYGSALTYFALNRLLHDMGYDVLMLEWPVRKKPVPISRSHARLLANQYYQICDQRTFEEYPNLNHYVDVFVVGSDQMWNCWGQKTVGDHFYLDFADDKHPKVAIATSFGHSEYVASEETVRARAKLLRSYSAVSVREDSGVDICREVFGVRAMQILDPVFLANKAYYETIMREEEQPYKEPYLFCYILTPTKEKGALLRKFAKKFGWKLVVCLDNQTSAEENKEALGFENVETNVGIGKWLSLIKNAEFVLTDSYHGVCFSMIFEKEFLCIINYKRGATRFESLFRLTGLASRGVSSVEEATAFDPAQKIEYASVNACLRKEAEFSRNWISRSLDNAMRERQSFLKKK